MRSFFVFGACAAIVACSSAITAPDDVAIFSDASVRDATLLFDAPPDFVDVEVFVDSAKFTGGGPFDCNGCICDGTLNACVFGLGGGGMPIADDAGDASDDASDAAPSCDLDAGNSPCFGIPLQCLPKPTCACLTAYFGNVCTCAVEPFGNGLVVTCPPKP